MIFHRGTWVTAVVDSLLSATPGETMQTHSHLSSVLWRHWGHKALGVFSCSFLRILARLHSWAVFWQLAVSLAAFPSTSHPTTVSYAHPRTGHVPRACLHSAACICGSFWSWYLSNVFFRITFSKAFNPPLLFWLFIFFWHILIVLSLWCTTFTDFL